MIYSWEEQVDILLHLEKYKPITRYDYKEPKEHIWKGMQYRNKEFDEEVLAFSSWVIWKLRKLRPDTHLSDHKYSSEDQRTNE